MADYEVFIPSGKCLSRAGILGEQNRGAELIPNRPIKASAQQCALPIERQSMGGNAGVSRRALLRAMSATATLGFMGTMVGCQPVSGRQSRKDLSSDVWAGAEQIRRTLKPPVFPDRIFDIREFGASIHSANNSPAIARAIEACHASGGGKVLVGEGRYLCGAIHLLSNVNLHLEQGAVLAFVSDLKAYLPLVKTRWEGMEMMGISPLIYAYQQNNIAITGAGLLDGQADDVTWWPWKGNNSAVNNNSNSAAFPTQQKARQQLQLDVERGLPVHERIYGEDAYLRPAFVQPYECKNILIQGVTLKNAPFWLLHPVLCENVTVDAVTCASHGPNNDGCDPESCKNLIIQNCFFDTGDDCIAIKSGRNADGRRLNVPSENILIRNCKMRKGHGGVVIGSEISGGVRNVFVEQCEMSSKELERGIRIKTNSVRGGTIENLHFRDIKIGEVQTAIVIDFQYEEGDAGNFTPLVQNITIDNLVCEQAAFVFQVRGYARAPIKHLLLSRCQFKRVENLGVLEHLTEFVSQNVLINGVSLNR